MAAALGDLIAHEPAPGAAPPEHVAPRPASAVELALVAGRTAIFYSLRGATAEQGSRLAVALAAILAKNGAAAIPPGMGPYRPRSADDR